MRSKMIGVMVPVQAFYSKHLKSQDLFTKVLSVKIKKIIRSKILMALSNHIIISLVFHIHSLRRTMVIMCILHMLCRTPTVTCRESCYYLKIIFFPKVMTQLKNTIINMKPKVKLKLRHLKRIFKTN